jgi:lysophospholipase
MAGFFEGKENVPIHYRFYEQPSATKAIVISSGRTEAAIKYKELIYDLYQNGYSVYIHDHRGQGLSGRMTENPDMGYIDDFQYYIDYMKQFYNLHILSKNYENGYLLAHSMGGAIGMTYIEQHPQDFDAAAFSSPMLGLKPPICRLVKKLDNGQPKFAIGESEYKDSKSSFQGNVLTSSNIRYNRMVDAFAKVPQARLGGATYTWLNKSCQQFDYMMTHIQQIEIPFIIFSAENEQIVSTKAHRRFVEAAKNLNKNCKLYPIEDAQHELLIEKDKPRLETLQIILDFYTSSKEF